jgi:hypothetical protein
MQPKLLATGLMGLIGTVYETAGTLETVTEAFYSLPRVTAGPAYVGVHVPMPISDHVYQMAFEHVLINELPQRLNQWL